MHVFIICCCFIQVLSIWLDRKILPVPVVKHFMKEIECHNDDKIVGSLPRRPSRSERAVDDPLREMEGMFVDEYGRYVTQVSEVMCRFWVNGILRKLGKFIIGM